MAGSGSRSLSARYSGDSSHSGAISSPSIVVVNTTKAFALAESIKDMQTNIGDVAVGDFNGDHKPDLVAVGSANFVQFAPGNGDGTFGSPIRSIIAGDSAYAYVVAVDFDEDGNPDLALSDAIADRIQIVFGHGDGTFGVGINLSGPHGRMVVADFNGDSHADLAVLHSSTNTVGVFLGNGHGAFAAAIEVPFAPNTTFSPLLAGDLNGDGKPDLITMVPANPLGGFVRNIVWIQGNGDGTFGTGFSFPFNGGYTPYDQMALGDLNGNSK